MKYIILTLESESREKHRKKIRTALSGLEEVKTTCVDGSDAQQLNSAIEYFGFGTQFDEWRPGEGGVWYSNIYAWEYIANQEEGVLVFEDDAIPTGYFERVVTSTPLPEGYDFITWYMPYFVPNAIMPMKLVPNYQEHGMVCMQYSPSGAAKMLDILDKEGLDWPVDIWIFKKALAGELAGYAPAQFCRKIVSHDFQIPTSIHENDRIKVWSPTSTAQ